MQMDGLYTESKPFEQFMATLAFEQLHTEYF